jgi:hypothetical protein
MRANGLNFGLTLAALLVTIPVWSRAADPTPAADPRYPVPVTSGEAVLQKTEMRGNLVALRDTLAALANKDFVSVESSLRRLVHTGPVAERAGVSTKVYRDLESQFEASVDKAVTAARSGNLEVVLRSLSDTMAYCQSCHMAFRQSVDSTGTTDPAR